MSQNKKSGPNIDPVTVAKTALRRWGFGAIVAGTMLGVAAAAATQWVWEPSYEAKQYVRIIQNREFTDIEQNRGQEQDAKTILAPIKSDLLLSSVLLNDDVNQVALREDPKLDLEKLRKMVRYEGGGELYMIICQSESPRLAAIIAQELTTKFIDYHDQDREANLKELTLNLNTEIALKEKEILDISSSLKDINDRRMNTDGKKPVDRDGIYLSEMLKVRYDEQLAMDHLETEVISAKQALENVGQGYDRAQFDSLVLASNPIRMLDERLDKLRTERQKLGSAGSSHPQIKSIDFQIDEATRRRGSEIEAQHQLQKDEWIRSQTSSLEGAIAENQAKIRQHKFNIEAYDQEVDRLVEVMRENNKIDFEFSQKLDEQRRAQDSLGEWIAKLDRIESKEKSLKLVKLAEKDAVVAVPTIPIERYPFKLLGMAFLGGFAIPLTLAFLWELRTERVSSFDQIQGQQRFKILGEVADLPVRTSRSTVLSSKRVTKQLRLYEESVDSLSAILSHASNDLPVAFSVTSAASNEGKTTLASQLAISSSKSNLGRTLLIDADLRSPSVHRLFDASLDVGLCDVLTGAETLQDAILRTRIDNLDVLTAGRIKTSPRRYFAGEEWANLLSEAGAMYDHVIVDTPPVLAASESLAISRQCDYSLMCVMRDVSRADGVKRAHDRLLDAGVNVIGCAFSGVPQNDYAAKYGSYEYNMS